MEKYGLKYNVNETFAGNITAEFKFNVLEVFTKHFKIHNIFKVLSFRPNEIIIQTMNDPRMVTNIETKGLYTTTIPLESLEEYEFECNCNEVNIMVTNALIASTSKVATGCNFINVVSDGNRNGNLVEVSFDLYEKKRRREARAQPRKPVSDNNNDNNNDGSVLFGKLMRIPYLHYLISSRVDYCLDYPTQDHLNKVQAKETS